MVDKIKGGWLEFDAVIATPDMMRLVGGLGKVLGPRGLMPNPKTGTVTFDVKTAVKETKAGKVEYRLDKTGVIHAAVGKVSFDESKIAENTLALIEAVVKAKPSTAKGKYMKKVNLASTMSPGGAFGTSTGAAGLLQSSAGLAVSRCTANTPTMITTIRAAA